MPVLQTAETKVKPGQHLPLRGQIAIHKLLARPLHAVESLFERQQRRIADQNGGVGALQHQVQIGSHGHKLDPRIAPLVEEDVRVSNRGAAGGVGGHRLQIGERLLARCTSSSERTRPFEAMVQPGRMRSSGEVASAAMGIRPISACPVASFAAHSAGVMRSMR